MAQKTESIIIPLKFTADTGEFLKNVSQMESSLKNLFDSGKLGEEAYKGSLKELEKLKQSFDDLGKNNGLSKAVSNFNDNLSKNLKGSTSQVKNFSEGFASIEGPIKRSETALDKFGRTLANSLRYNLVNNFVDSVLSKWQEVITFLEDVDENLTNIRIVSGKSQSEMNGFLETGMATAKELGSVTNDYLKASEIYYQQGLSTNEVMERTNATVQAANISNQSVSSTADQATAILNGFNVEASKTVEVLDKIAQVGAGTATDFEEIAKASQKVAASASDANFTIDQTLGMIATISSVTREAPETIGTSLNAIIGRFNDLKVADSEYTSNIEKVFKATGSGLTVFDEATGQLKDIPQILDEVAAAWDTLSENAQKAITTQMAGTRQANRLRALLGNYDMYKEYTAMSEDSEGALARQNAIYMESLEAIQNQAQVSAEALYGELLNTDMLKVFYSTLSDILDLLTSVVDKTGGLQGILTSGAALLRKPLINTIAPSVARWGQDTFGKKERETFNKEIEKDEKDYNKTTEGEKIKLLRYDEMALSLTREEQAEYKENLNLLKQQAALREKLNNLKKEPISKTFEQQALNEQVLKQRTEDSLLKVQNINKKINYNSENFTGLFDPKKSYSQLNDQLGTVYQELNESIKELEASQKKATEENSKNIQQQIDNYEKLKEAILETKNATEDKKYPLEGAERELPSSNDYFQTTEAKNLLDSYSQLNPEEQKAIATSIANKKKYTNVYKILTGEEIEITNERKAAIIAALNEELTKHNELLEVNKKRTGEQIENNKEEEESILNNFRILGKGVDVAKIFDIVSKGAIGLTGGLQIMNVAMDNSLTNSQKLEGALSGLGATLSLLPGVYGAIGTAISVLGPILLEVTGIGQSQTEKLNNQINAIKEANNSLTKNVNQQAQDLASISSTYDDLVKNYKETGATFDQLTEEQKSQYAQVAEYAENYAPELIKYYNTEGQAILDLSGKYEQAANSKKNYLQLKAEENQLSLYSTMQDSASENAALLVENYGVSFQKIQDLQTKIAETRQKGLEGKDVTKELSSLEEQLSSYREQVNSISSDWDEMFSQIILKGNAAFYNLGTTMQNSLLQASSFNSFLLSNEDFTSARFQERIQTLTDALGDLSQEQLDIFNSLNQSQADFFTTLFSNLELTKDQLTQIFSEIQSSQDLLRGGYLTDAINMSQQNFANQVANSSEIGQQYVQNQQYLPEQSLSLESAPLETGGVNISDLKTQNKHLEKQASILEDRTSAVQNITGGAVPFDYLEGLPEDLVNYDPDNGIEGLLDDLESIREAIKENQEVIEEYNDANDEVMNNFEKAVRDMAKSGNEGFNEVRDAYEEMYKYAEENGMDALAEKYGESTEVMEEKMGRMYANLNGDNQEYFNSWVEANTGAILENAANLGVYAEDYKTYAEYMDAVDAARAQTKVYYEMLANGDIAGLSEALKQKKIGDYITEQMAAGNKANVISFLALSEADQVKYAENEKKLAVLKSVRDSLTTAMQGAQGSMDLNAQVGDNSLETIGDVIKGANSALTSIGAPTISFSGNKVKKKVVEDVLKYVEDKISETKKEQNELKNKGEEASKDNQDLKDFVNDLENIYNGMDSPNYNYPMGGNIPSAKPTGGGGKIPTNSPTSSGGGGGGGSGSTPKEVEDLELELDPLKRYNDLLDRIDHELDIIKEQKDRVYGKQYIDALNKEVELNRESLKVQQDKLAKIKELEKEQQEALKKQGVEFDENGLISNYNELLKKKQDEANKLSGDTKEDAKEAVEKLQDAMDKYEDEVIDSKRDALKAIEEIKTDLSDLAVEKIQYTIELIVDATEEDSDLIEFIGDAQRLKKGKFSFSIIAEESAKQLINSMQGIQDVFAQTGDANKFINDILTNPDLKGNTQAQMDLIKEQQEQMQDLASDLMDFAEELGEAFADGLDEALDLLEEEFDRYENIIGQYEYIIDMAEGLNLNNIDNLDNLYGNITSIYEKNIEQSRQAAEIFKNSRDQFEKGSEEWILANDKYMEMQSQVIDQESELADLLQDKYDIATESGRLKLEEALFGGQTLDDIQEDLDEINEYREKYLDTETKIYSLSKLERQINKDIQSYQYDPETQAALKKFMDDELKYLNSKEKLTQTDLDLATQQYNVVKARIDLERAYNSEQYQMMLQRNADGTFGYMYVQNTDAVEDAKQAYEDAVNELYQFASEKNAELQQESVDIRSNALDEYDKIVERLKAGTISEEEAVEQLNKAFEDMKKKLEENAKAQAEMQQQMASAKLLQILGVSESELDGLDSLEEKLIKTFDILNNNGEVNNLSETIKALGLNAEDYTGTVGEQVSQIYKDLGANEEALEKMMEAFANSGDATAATILGLLQKTGDLSELTQDILNNSLAGAGDSFDSMIDRITSGLVNTGDIFDESFKNGLEGMDELWDSLSTTIAGDLEQISKEFDPENPDGALSQVTNGILSAYEEWQKALEDSYQDIMDRNDELIDMTEEYNKHLQDTINKTNEELAQLTELTKKYQDLREEVLASIDEVLKYIEILDQAKDKIETEGGIHASDAEKEKVEITEKMMYNSPYSSSPIMLTASGNEFYTDGSVNNKFRVKSADDSYIGWFDASSLKAFHDGGQVDVNKEGLALVKKNEAVFTEQELSFINGIKDVLYDMQSKINLPQMVNSDSSVSQNIQIHASFPNANNADEIEKAFESLYINSSQYINKK